MTSDALLSDFSEPLTDEQILNIPMSDFSEPIKAPISDFSPPVNESVFIESHNTAVSAPGGVSGEKITYLNDIQNNMVSPSEYVGDTKIIKDGVLTLGEVNETAAITSINLIKGFVRNVGAIGKRGAEFDVRTAELGIESAKKREEASFSDIFTALLPTGRGKVAEARISEFFGNDTALEDAVAKLKDVKVQGLDTLEKYDIVLDNMGLKKIKGNVVTDFAFNTGQGAQSLLELFGVSAMTKDPVAMYSYLSEMQRGANYIEARDAGLDVADADFSAMIRGNTSAVINTMGFGLLRNWSKSSLGLKRMVGGVVNESAEEGIEEAADIALSNQYDITNISMEEGIGRVAYAALMGGFLGAPASISFDNSMAIAKEEGIGRDFAEAMHNKITDNFGVAQEILENTVREEIENLEGHTEQTSKTVAMLNDFANGVDVKIDKQSLADIESQVDEKLTAIDAQENKNLVPIPKRPETLSQFLKKAGGIKDDTGEAKRFTNKESPELKGVANKNGALSLDEARDLALQAGFLTDAGGEGVTESSTQDLLDALEQESLGVDIVRDVDQGLAMDRAQAMEFNSQQIELNDEIASQSKKLRTIKEAFKAGVSTAKKDVKAVQETIIKAIDDAGLKAEEKAKFIKKIKNVQTVRQLRKAEPGIINRIEGLLTKRKRGELKGKIKSALKSTKVIKQSGKPVSKFADANIQQSLDVLRKANSLTKEAAGEKLASNLAVDPMNITLDMVLENKMLSIVSAGKDARIGDVADMFTDIKTMMVTGRARKEAALIQRKAIIEDIKTNLIDGITKGKPLKELNDLEIKDKLKLGLNKARAAESGLNNGWFDTLDLILGKLGVNTRDQLTSSVAQAINEEKRLYLDYSKRFENIATKFLPAKTSRQFQRQSLQDEKVVTIGKFAREGESVVKPWKLSRAQGRKLWMELQDPTLRDTLMSKEGNGITESMEHALENDFLNQNDILFAQAQLDLYKELYNEVNTTYANTYGVNLPNNPFYSPIRREHDEEINPNTNEFLEEVKARAGTVPSFGKLRVNNNNKILVQSDLSVMMNHIAQSSHFIAMSETARDLNAVFSDSTVSKAIKNTWGDAMKENIDGYIRDFTVGHVQRAEKWSESLNVLNKNFAISVLGLKLNLYPKQMVSTFAFASDIPTIDYVAGMSKFIANPKIAIDILSKTAFMQARGASQDIDIIKGINTNKLSSKKKSLENFLLFSTKLGDRGAIYMGGYSVYLHAKKNGATEEEALMAFTEAARRTQQSSDLDQMSRLQANRNPFYKAMTMFATSPNAYWRAEKRAIRQLTRGQISKAEFGKKMFIFHFLLPMLFQYISDGFDYDEDNQTRAMVLGSLNGFMILGSILQDAGAAAQGKFFPKDELNFTKGISDLFFDGAKSYRKGDISFEDIMESAGLISGMPVKQGINIVEGVEDINQGDTGTGVMRVLGWTEYSLGKNDKKKKVF